MIATMELQTSVLSTGGECYVGDIPYTHKDVIVVTIIYLCIYDVIGIGA